MDNFKRDLRHQTQVTHVQFTGWGPSTGGFSGVQSKSINGCGGLGPVVFCFPDTAGRMQNHAPRTHRQGTVDPFAAEITTLNAEKSIWQSQYCSHTGTLDPRQENYGACYRS